MKSRNRSIRSKILWLVISVCLMAVLMITGVSVYGMQILRQDTLSICNKLETPVADDSQQALAEQAKLRLSEIARGKAALSDEVLSGLSRQAQMLGSMGTRLYSSPYDQPHILVNPPDRSKSGTITAQLLAAEGVNTGWMYNEVALLGNLGKVMEEIIRSNELIISVQVGTESGLLLQADDAPELKPKFSDPRELPWYKAAKEAGKPIWSDVENDDGRGLGVVRAYPIYDTKGELKGVSSVGMLLTPIIDNVASTKVGESGYVFLMNERGEIISSPAIKKDDKGNIISESYLESENAQLREIAKRMTNGERGVAQLSMDGKEVFMAFEPLSVVPWSIGAVIGVEEVVAPAAQSQLKFTGITDSTANEINEKIRVIISMLVSVAAAVFIIALVLSLIISRSVVKPIKELNSSVMEIDYSNLNLDLDIHTGDEIERLAISVRDMTDKLKRYIGDITKSTAEKERIVAELNVATSIQTSMLPSIFPAFLEHSEIDVYATMNIAKEVGGDFCDFFLVDNDHLAVVMADVSGKGVPAALFAVIAKTIIKNYTQNKRSPEEVFTNANRQLCENNEAGLFVTAWMGILNMRNGHFVYVNAGHNPPALMHAGQKYKLLPNKPGFVLAGMEGVKYEQCDMKLLPGDVLYLYTDGVTEATDLNDELYGEDRMLAVLNKNQKLTVNELLPAVRRDIELFVGEAPQSDDITMLALKFNGK